MVRGEPNYNMTSPIKEEFAGKENVFHKSTLR
jgi:hypothetical protein